MTMPPRPMNILIVESRAKCKTLLKHLGKNEWRVLPTGGHVQRLAEDRKIHPPKEVHKAYWSHRPGELPVPPWFWTERGEVAIGAIKDEAVKHDSRLSQESSGFKERSRSMCKRVRPPRCFCPNSCPEASRIQLLQTNSANGLISRNHLSSSLGGAGIARPRGPFPRPGQACHSG